MILSLFHLQYSVNLDESPHSDLLDFETGLCQIGSGSFAKNKEAPFSRSQIPEDLGVPYPLLFIRDLCPGLQFISLTTFFTINELSFPLTPLRLTAKTLDPVTWRTCSPLSSSHTLSFPQLRMVFFLCFSKLCCNSNVNPYKKPFPSLPVPTILIYTSLIELSAVQTQANILTSLRLFSHQKNVNNVTDQVPQEADLVSVQIYYERLLGHHW